MWFYLLTYKISLCNLILEISFACLFPEPGVKEGQVETKARCLNYNHTFICFFFGRTVKKRAYLTESDLKKVV